jgi:hypothetical protein
VIPVEVERQTKMTRRMQDKYRLSIDVEKGKDKN